MMTTMIKALGAAGTIPLRLMWATKNGENPVFDDKGMMAPPAWEGPGFLPDFEWNRNKNSMEPHYQQNILERTFPHLREMRERAEKEAQLFPSIEKTDLDAFEVGGEAGLYFGVPYDIGPVGKNLNTFAWRVPNKELLQFSFRFRG